MKGRWIVRVVVGKGESDLQVWRQWRTRASVAALFVLVVEWNRGRVERLPRGHQLCRLRGLSTDISGWRLSQKYMERKDKSVHIGQVAQESLGTY